MTKVSDKCKEYRKYFKSEIEYLIDCSNLPHDNPEYISKQEVEQILDESPEYNVTSRVKDNLIKKLYNK